MQPEAGGGGRSKTKAPIALYTARSEHCDKAQLGQWAVGASEWNFITHHTRHREWNSGRWVREGEGGTNPPRRACRMTLHVLRIRLDCSLVQSKRIHQHRTSNVQRSVYNATSRQQATAARAEQQEQSSQSRAGPRTRTSQRRASLKPKKLV